jgi:hypothetical protein
MFPPYNLFMDWLINTLFSIILVTDVRSPDPAVAAMKRARLGMIVCAIGEAVFLVLAFAVQPDAAAAVSPAQTSQDLVSRLYAGAAVCSMAGLLWNAWLWWRAYNSLDRHVGGSGI